MRVVLDGGNGMAGPMVGPLLADAMAALTLLLVALLKNAEHRAEHAIQVKRDRLAEALLAERREHSRESASGPGCAPCNLA